MNYIELINHFWQTRRSKRITSVQADLYYFLLQESNLRNWENPFECTNGLICASISITEPTLIDARNRLQQYGLISFENGKRRAFSPVYYLNNFSKDFSKHHSKHRAIALVNTEQTPPPLYMNKPNQTKEKDKQKECDNTQPDFVAIEQTKKIEKKDKPQKVALKSPFDFDEAWNAYQKKGNKKTSQRRWDALSVANKEKALNNIPQYVEATPDVQYRKNFETYLNQEVWNDKIIVNGKKSNGLNVADIEKFGANLQQGWDRGIQERERSNRD